MTNNTIISRYSLFYFKNSNCDKELVLTVNKGKNLQRTKRSSMKDTRDRKYKYLPETIELSGICHFSVKEIRCYSVCSVATIDPHPILFENIGRLFFLTLMVGL